MLSFSFSQEKKFLNKIFRSVIFILVFFSVFWNNEFSPQTSLVVVTVVNPRVLLGRESAGRSTKNTCTFKLFMTIFTNIPFVSSPSLTKTFLLLLSKIVCTRNSIRNFYQSISYTFPHLHYFVTWSLVPH